MVLLIEEQFCNQFRNSEELDNYISIYNDNNIRFSRGYMKLCVLKQEIETNEVLAKKLFFMWPDLDISYQGDISNFILNIKSKI